MNAFISSLWTRLTLSVSRSFGRVAGDATDGLEQYLSTAKSLHQLEDMQRSWDREHRGRHTFGAL